MTLVKCDTFKACHSAFLMKCVKNYAKLHAIWPSWPTVLTQQTAQCHIYIPPSCVDNPRNAFDTKYIPLTIFNLSHLDHLYIGRDTVAAFADEPTVDVEPPKRRLYIDFNDLQQQDGRTRGQISIHPLPKIDKMYAKLKGAKVFPQ